ncbi:MAG: prepilin-type N-terminal cleavage/methylation domain-containing protein [Alistipes sp.]|nr:prepilin-type N-terminal cleavage/methylation domain-containing protein [Alistipes sp.]
MEKSIMKGFTLTECLVVMLVGGIVFLGITEGLDMFLGYTASRSAVMEREQLTFEDLVTVNELFSVCDSMEISAANVSAYRNGTRAVLTIVDGMVVLNRSNHTDTLFGGCAAELVLPDKKTEGGLPVFSLRANPDNGEGFTVDYFPRLSPAVENLRKLEETEEGFRYE